MIDREKVIKESEEAIDVLAKAEEHTFWMDFVRCAFEDALSLLKEQDAVSAHWDDDVGHWIEGDRDGIDPHTRTTGEMIDTFRCSWCGFYQYWETPFCPNCGAKMEGL